MEIWKMQTQGKSVVVWEMRREEERDTSEKTLGGDAYVILIVVVVSGVYTFVNGNL